MMNRDKPWHAIRASLKKDLSLSQKLLTLQDLTALLGISRATAKNWIKSGRITPTGYEKGELVFLNSHIITLKRQLENNQVKYLRSRRNKRFKRGIVVPKGYIRNESVERQLIDFAETLEGYPLDDLAVRLIMAEAALQRLAHRGLIPTIAEDWGYSSAYVGGTLYLEQLEPLLADLLVGIDSECLVRLCKALTPLPNLNVDFYEDVLGLLYMILQCVSTRKGSGAYYTPHQVADETIADLEAVAGGKLAGLVLDPACGTGQFVLAYLKRNQTHLDDQVVGCPYLSCHGYDIDPISILITRLNVVVATGWVDLEILYQQFRLMDTLLDTSEMLFDCIFGNPPWGYVYDKTQQTLLRERYHLAQSTRVESFALFVEWSKLHLKSTGWLGFVLPESTLMVKAHGPLREMIRLSFSLYRVRFLDYGFSGVVAPAIVMTMGKKTCLGPDVSTAGDKEVKYNDLSLTRWTSDGSFLVRPSDQVYALIQTIEKRSYTTLKNQGLFAMGIVTGDNTYFLTHEAGPDRQLILRGADIRPYQIVGSGVFIRTGANYQQRAPIEIYRTEEKLVYRFIASQPIVALDDRQRLTLNSCNCLIPNVPGYSIHVIMAVLNASVSAFYYKNRFSSVKVLKSHLESMPIPPLTEQQKKEIENWVFCLTVTQDPILFAFYREKIDQLIADAFGLTPVQQKLIQSQLSDSNSAEKA